MASQFGNDNFLIINNVKMPIPAYGLSISTAQGVDAGRNANNQIVGQRVGRRQWKINNLQWKGLSPDQVKIIKDALADFYVPVSFIGDDKKIHKIHMYPGDTDGKPLAVKDMSYTMFETYKFNLIDCGWDEETEK